MSPQTKNEYKQALVRAIKLLSIREHSAKELLAKLINKNFSTIIANKVLLTLQQQNLQSDIRFAESFVSSWANKGRGEIRIKYDLEQHDIETKHIKVAFDHIAIDWQQQLKQVWQKKFNSYPRSWSEKATQFRFLQQRGFATEEINNLIKTSS